MEWFFYVNSHYYGRIVTSLHGDARQAEMLIEQNGLTIAANTGFSVELKTLEQHQEAQKDGDIRR